MNCPKCGRKDFEADECPYCGIIISKYIKAKEKRKERLDASRERLVKWANEGPGDGGSRGGKAPFKIIDALDLTFSKFYTSIYVKILYVLYICLLFFGSFALFLYGGKSGWAFAALGIILIAAPVIWIMFRVSLEAILILFRIEEHLRELVHVEYEKMDE